MDVPDVRRGPPKATRVTKLALFTALCDVTTALQGECYRMCFSPLKMTLEALCERLDVVIDTVLEEGVQEDEPHADA